jgi:hypothetical protein
MTDRPTLLSIERLPDGGFVVGGRRAFTTEAEALRYCNKVWDAGHAAARIEQIAKEFHRVGDDGDWPIVSEGNGYCDGA